MRHGCFRKSAFIFGDYGILVNEANEMIQAAEVLIWARCGLPQAYTFAEVAWMEAIESLSARREKRQMAAVDAAFLAWERGH